MKNLNEAKNQLSLCRNKDQIYSALDSICSEAGFNYDIGMGFSYNIRRARSASSYRVVEVIQCAEKLEGRL